MRLIKVNVPEGQGIKIVEIAHKAGIKEVSLHKAELFKENEPKKTLDVVELQASTPLIKTFVDSLLEAPFFDPADYTFAVREPRSIVSSEKVKELTKPIVLPDTDVYEELWQFSQITFSFVARTLIASMLLGYGMVKLNILAIIAGLIFLPYVHQMLSVSFGLSTREWGLFFQGLKALFLATVLIILSGMIDALILKEPVAYQQFGSPLSGFLIAIIIGIAASLASADDSGRREMIGLALTSQTTIFPAWFGLSLVSGFPEYEKISSNILSYFINMLTIVLSSSITYRFLGMGRKPLKKFLEKHASRK